MRAKPWITCGLMAGVAALPVSALALGLGRLTVDSALGQPLSARVELTAAQKDELDTLQAKIAEPSVYRDNNVQYPPGVARARVSVEQGPNNSYYLKVATPQALNEPFIDLIVEVNWATGRVVRNYTFLLDPPGAGETQAVEPVAPVRAAERAPARRGAESGAGPRAGAGGAGDNTYTVKRGDTLSKIAKEYKPADVTLEQMLVALFRSNESAFDGKNMNRLRSGHILNIPPADQPGSMGKSEATQVVKVQAADWRAYRDRVAAAAPTTEAAPTGQAAGGRISTAVEEKGAAPQAGKDQLKVSREAGKGGGAGVAQAPEDTAAKDRALREANSRIAELESTLKNMQKAVELKSQTMADMQKQADAGKGAKAVESSKSGTTTAGTAPAAQAPVAPPPIVQAPAAQAPTAQTPATTAPTAQTPATTAPSASSPAAPATSASAPAPQAKAPETPATETKTTETKATETKAPEAAPGVPATEAKAPDEKAPESKVSPAQPKATKAKAAPPPPPSFFDDLYANTPTWAIGAAALVLLGGIAAIIVTRRRKTTKFEDSIISGTDIKTNTVFGSTGGGVVNTGDNSLASDFSREGLGNIDTDEVDPIAEAEVYLAYGRDAQAEEILKEALKKDPQRQEIYLKLLEIHAQHNKPSAFETVASELYSVSGGQGEVWQKAMALGRQLDPNNPMFTEGGSAAAFAAVAGEPAPVAAPQEAGEPTLPSPAVEAPAAAPAPAPQAARSVDFTLDEEISLSPTSGEASDVKTPAAILAGAAEQVAKSTRGAAGVAGTAAAAAKSTDSKRAAPFDDVSFGPESVPRFDLDFNLDEPSRPGPPMSTPVTSITPKPAPKPAAPEPALAAVAAGAPAPQLARPAAAIELDKLDLAFDPQRSTFEDPTPSVLDGQWHDAATKLDLAKAYQEMGDVEGAREILQEVLHEGDDQQKAEAQGLLAKLA
ncbi:MAG TPA: FimV/HubP family polar landmark protein [Casimicrobiaceae bacterium]|nr:FimV/HubP family polar landmark protein [Casimicrobiaceae bacterium]